MKQLLFTLVAVLMGTFYLKAQTHPLEINLSGYKQIAQRETTMMVNRLLLTAIQADSVLQINDSYYYGIACLRNLQLTGKERGQRLQFLESGRKTRLQANLNESQYNQLLKDNEKVKRRIDSLRTVHHIN